MVIDKAVKEVILCGAGGHAKVVLRLLQLLGFRVPYILDDAPDKIGSSIHGVPVRGPLELLPDRSDISAFIAIGDNRMREQAAARFKNVNWVTLVHPFSWVDPTAQLGAGTCIIAGAVIQADAALGKHVIVNTSASVGHDCVIEDFAQVAPGVRLGGESRLGRGAFCGIGAAVLPDRRIGAWATLGARAAAVKDVPPGETWLGVPARAMEQRH